MQQKFFKTHHWQVKQEFVRKKLRYLPLTKKEKELVEMVDAMADAIPEDDEFP